MQTYKVMVKPNKKQNKVYWKQFPLDEKNQYLVVETTELPTKGQANKMVIELVAGFFKLPKSSIMIKKGIKSKFKMVMVC